MHKCQCQSQHIYAYSINTILIRQTNNTNAAAYNILNKLKELLIKSTCPLHETDKIVSSMTFSLSSR